MKKYVVALGLLFGCWISKNKIIYLIPCRAIEKKNIILEHYFGQTVIQIHAPKVIFKIPYFFTSCAKDIEIFNPKILITKEKKGEKIFFLRRLIIHKGDWGYVENIDLKISNDIKIRQKAFLIHLKKSKYFGWKGSVLKNANQIGDCILDISNHKINFYLKGKLNAHSFGGSGEILADRSFKIRCEYDALILRAKGSKDLATYRMDLGKTNLKGTYSFASQNYKLKIFNLEYLQEKLECPLPKVEELDAFGEWGRNFHIQTPCGGFDIVKTDRSFALKSTIQNLPCTKNFFSLKADIHSHFNKINGSLSGIIDEMAFCGKWKNGKGYLKCEDENDLINWTFLNEDNGEIFHKNKNFYTKVQYEKSEKNVNFPLIDLKGNDWLMKGKGFYNSKMHFQGSLNAKKISDHYIETKSSFLVTVLKKKLWEFFLKSTTNVCLNIDNFYFKDFNAQKIKGDLNLNNETISLNSDGVLNNGSFHLAALSRDNIANLAFKIKDCNGNSLGGFFKNSRINSFMIDGSFNLNEFPKSFSGKWNAHVENIVLQDIENTPIIKLQNAILEGSIKKSIIKGFAKKMTGPNANLSAHFFFNLNKNILSLSAKGKTNNKNIKFLAKGKPEKLKIQSFS
jgi:hypothetical protein